MGASAVTLGSEKHQIEMEWEGRVSSLADQHELQHGVSLGMP